MDEATRTVRLLRLVRAFARCGCLIYERAMIAEEHEHTDGGRCTRRVLAEYRPPMAELDEAHPESP